MDRIIRWGLIFSVAGILLLGSSAAYAEMIISTVDLNQLNNSNVSGNGVLTVDTDAQTLRVELSGQNLEEGEDHMLHIHGNFNPDGSAADSTAPTLADDGDGDGLIEVLEGVPAYGDIILPLGMIPAGDIGAGGTFSYDNTFSLTDDSLYMSPVTGNDYTSADLFPLSLREIVIHGKTVADGIGAGTDGEADGTGGYKGLLPVAAGNIVPEPAAISLALTALLGFAAARKRML
jgi:hypothetical protein